MEIGSTGIVALQKLRCYKGIMDTHSVRSLSDDQLLRDLERAATSERNATVHLIALLAEMDSRRLYLQQGYSSLFTYCTACLLLSEHAAYGRIEAARATRKYPIILDRLADGSITLTTICLLSNHLSLQNHRQLLNAARHKTRREVEHQVAALRPMPDAPSAIRKLPEKTPPSEPEIAIDVSVQNARSIPVAPPTPEPRGAAPPMTAIVRPLALERYKVQFTIGPETHRKLRTLQDLMRHVVPNGDIGEIFDRALTVLLREVEQRKLARADHPREENKAKATGRHVPAAVKRQVWARDQGQCAFVGAKGRCDERGFLEFHHVIPFAEGGETTVANLQLRCRAHNDCEAREHFGWSLLRERMDYSSVT